MPQTRILKVATLARLELNKEETETYARQVDEILLYMSKLGQVPTDGVDPLFRPFATESPLREDQVQTPARTTEGLPKVLEHAPDVLHGGFKVPQIV